MSHEYELIVETDEQNHLAAQANTTYTLPRIANLIARPEFEALNRFWFNMRWRWRGCRGKWMSWWRKPGNETPG